MRQGGESLRPAVIPSALALETWLGDHLKDVGGCSARIDAFSGSLWAVGTSFDVKVEGVSERIGMGGQVVHETDKKNRGYYRDRDYVDCDNNI